MILLCVSANEGRLARWETGGEKPRLTHAYEHGAAATFTESVLDDMRDNPPEHLRIAGPEEFTPSPTPPNAIAARAA